MLNFKFPKILSNKSPLKYAIIETLFRLYTQSILKSI